MYITTFSQGSLIVDFNIEFKAPQQNLEDVTTAFNGGYSNLNSTGFTLDTNFTGNEMTSPIKQ